MPKGQTTPIELTYPMSSSDLDLRCYGQTFFLKRDWLLNRGLGVIWWQNREQGAGNKGHLKYLETSEMSAMCIWIHSIIAYYMAGLERLIPKFDDLCRKIMSISCCSMRLIGLTELVRRLFGLVIRPIYCISKLIALCS